MILGGRNIFFQIGGLLIFISKILKLFCNTSSFLLLAKSASLIKTTTVTGLIILKLPVYFYKIILSIPATTQDALSAALIVILWSKLLNIANHSCIHELFPEVQEDINGVSTLQKYNIPSHNPP